MGLAIGLDQEFQLEGNNIPQEERPVLIKVEYQVEKFKCLVNKFVELAISIMKEANLTSHSNSEAKQFITCLHKQLLIQCLPLLPMAKDHSYSIENEYRLYLSEGIIRKSDEYPSGFYFPEVRRKYCKIPYKNKAPCIMEKEIVDNEPIVKRYVYSLPFRKETVKEIIIGPRCKENETIYLIQKLLTENGYVLNNIKIRQATSSYFG